MVSEYSIHPEIFVLMNIHGYDIMTYYVLLDLASSIPAALVSRYLRLIVTCEPSDDLSHVKITDESITFAQNCLKKH